MFLGSARTPTEVLFHDRLIFQAWLLCLISFALSVRAVSETLIVDQSGSSQFATIASALKKAKEGDVVEVRAGKYIESIEIKKNISLIGSGAPTTIVSAPKSVLQVVKRTGGVVSGFTFEVQSIAKAPAVIIEVAGKAFRFENNVVNSTASPDGDDPAPLVRIDGGAPAMTGNSINGSVEVIDGANVDLRNETFGNALVSDQSTKAPLILCNYRVDGITKFQGNGIINVNLIKPVVNATKRNIRLAFPMSISSDESTVALPQGYWEIVAEVGPVAGNYDGARNVCRADVSVTLHLFKDGSTSLISVTETSAAEESSPTIVERDGKYYIDYGGIAGGVGRALGQDPFANAAKDAVRKGLPALAQKAKAAASVLQQLDEFDIAIKKAEAGDLAPLEMLATQASQPEIRQAANTQLVNMKIQNAINTRDESVLRDFVQEYPSHDKVPAINVVLSDIEKEKRTMAALKQKELMEIEQKEHLDEYQPYKDQNTFEGYRDFIDKHPASPFVDDARKRMEDLRTYFKVTALPGADNKVDVKKEPKVFSEPATRVAHGAILPVISRDEKWICVDLKGSKGYLPAESGKLGKKSEL